MGWHSLWGAGTGRPGRHIPFLLRQADRFVVIGGAEMRSSCRARSRNAHCALPQPLELAAQPTRASGKALLRVTPSSRI